MKLSTTRDGFLVSVGVELHEVSGAGYIEPEPAIVTVDEDTGLLVARRHCEGESCEGYHYDEYDSPVGQCFFLKPLAERMADVWFKEYVQYVEEEEREYQAQRAEHEEVKRCKRLGAGG